MDPRKLQRVIVDALEDVKAQAIEVFNTTGQTGLFDRVILATGTSNRQTRALASHVRDKIKAAGGHVISVEGEDSGEWVLVDAGDAVVHIMQPAIRAYYNLEEIWGSKPVRLKSRAAGMRQASTGDPSSRDEAAQPPSADEVAEFDTDTDKAAVAGEIDIRAPARSARTRTAKTQTAKAPAAKVTTGRKATTSKPAAKKATARKLAASNEPSAAKKPNPAKKPAAAGKAATATRRPRAS